MPTPLQRTQAVLFCADFKHEAADFCVDEELGFECSGSGEHVWVLIRKPGSTRSTPPAGWRVLPVLICGW